MTAQSVPENNAVATARPEAEAARYALLRRLAPSFRHHLVVNLQPIGMVYEVMDRRLRSPQPDLGELHQGAQKINTLARAALDSCLDVVTWLAPEPGKTVALAEGVRECLLLIGTSLTFRGYALRNEAESLAAQVPRAAMRSVLTAALLHLTDHQPPPAELVLTASAQAQGLVLAIEVRATDGTQGIAAEPAYRRLDAADLDAIAAAESVEVIREGANLRLVFPAA